MISELVITDLLYSFFFFCPDIHIKTEDQNALKNYQTSTYLFPSKVKQNRKMTKYKMAKLKNGTT